MKNFKKVAIFVCAVLVAMLSACNKAETKEAKAPEETAKVAQVSEVSEENIMLKISEANTRDAFLNNRDEIGYIVKSKYADEEQHTIYTYQDKDKYVCVEEFGAEKYILIDRSGEIVWYDQSKQKYSTSVFVGEGAYEDFKKFCSVAFCSYEPLEKVISMEESGDRLIIEAEITDAEILKSTAEAYGYETDKIEKEACYYEVDAKTYEIYKCSFVLVLKDGSTVEMQTAELTENYDQCLSSETLDFDMAGLEKRKYTLIENPGTEEEIKHEYEVPLGIGCGAWLSNEYDPARYVDPEFKIEVGSEEAPESDFNKDFIGYIRKKQ